MTECLNAVGFVFNSVKTYIKTDKSCKYSKYYCQNCGNQYRNQHRNQHRNQNRNQNRNQYNLTQLQRQATPEEAEELLKTGFWPWPDDLKQLYIEKVSDNPIIKIEPQYALNYAMKLYNKNAVTELLAWNTKEGHLLLYGTQNNIKCSPDSVMQKGGTEIKIENIPNEIPGFSFVKGSCNPCLALDADFSCPFKLGDDSISEPWRKLWNL